MSTKQNALIISDTQAPFAHRDAMRFLSAVADVVKPKHVYHVGDEIDAHACARNYTPHPDAPSAGDEFALAAAWLDELEKLFPRMSIAYSNHTARLFKAAAEARLPSQLIRPLAEAYNKPQWKWAWSWDLPWRHGTVVVEHGHRRKDPLKRALELGESVMQGHHHADMGIHWRNSRRRMLFGAALGCLCDANALALSYAKEAPFGQMLGCGAVVGGWPVLFHMDLDKRGRWTGRLV